jgi:hypothetical protein
MARRVRSISVADTSSMTAFVFCTDWAELNERRIVDAVTDAATQALRRAEVLIAYVAGQAPG